MTRPFKFGTILFPLGTRKEWEDASRLTEDLGYDVLGITDQLWVNSPFQTLLVAGDVTERITLLVHVLNATFYHPVVLARDIATFDQFTGGGRVEIGVGAGIAQDPQYAEVLDKQSSQKPGDRVTQLETTLVELRRIFADVDEAVANKGMDADTAGDRETRFVEALPKVRPAGPIRIYVAGQRDRIVGLAAKYADGYILLGPRDPVPHPPRVPAVLTCDDAAERIAFLRERAGDRADEIETNVAIQVVRVTNDRRGAAEEIQRVIAPYLSIEQILDSPKILVGTIDQMVEQVSEWRERLGIAFYSLLVPDLQVLHEFAPVVERLKGK
jgi:probable F420-dependent oxidoreductase